MTATTTTDPTAAIPTATEIDALADAYDAARKAASAHYDRDAATGRAMASAPYPSAEYDAAKLAYEREHCSREIYTRAERLAGDAYFAARKAAGLDR